MSFKQVVKQEIVVSWEFNHSMKTGLVIKIKVNLRNKCKKAPSIMP